MEKDLFLPKLYCQLRDTLVGNGWTYASQSAQDTFLMLNSPDLSVRVIINFSKDCVSVFPNGTWSLRCNLDPDLYDIGTTIRPISEEMSTVFIHDMTVMFKTFELLKQYRLYPALKPEYDRNTGKPIL